MLKWWVGVGREESKRLMYIIIVLKFSKVLQVKLPDSTNIVGKLWVG